MGIAKTVRSVWNSPLHGECQILGTASRDTFADSVYIPVSELTTGQKEKSYRYAGKPDELPVDQRNKNTL
ncbi:hypothetical protein JEZ13_04205 [bacterium]|nr:hypothetical protein [bacterium]MBI9072938.1 hypothetical protein [Melioribacteraceae bacterium]